MRTNDSQTTTLLVASTITVSLAVGIGLLMTQHSPLLAVVGMVAAAGTFAALASTEAALYALIAVSCFDGLIKGMQPGLASMLLKDVFLVVALLHWAWDGMNRQPRVSLGHPVALPAVLFMSYCAAQMFNTETMSWTLAIAGLRSWIIWIPVFFIAYDTIRTRRQFERLMMFVAFISAGTGVYIIVQHQIGFSHLYAISPTFGFYTKFEHGVALRAPGTYVHPGTAGSAMSFAATVCAGVGLAARAFSPTQLLLLASAPVCLIATAATGSRAPVVGAAFGLFVFLLMTRRARLGLGLALVLLIGAWQAEHFVGSMMSVRYSQRLLNPRVIWGRAVGPFTKAFELLSQYPLGTGVASGAGSGRALRYMDEPLYVKDHAAVFIENELGRAMKELGLPGVLLLMWLLYRALRGGLVGWRLSTGRDRWLAGGLMAGALNLSVQLMVGSALYLAPGGSYFWLACALASRIPDYEAQDRAALEERTPEDIEAWEELTRHAAAPDRATMTPRS